MINLTIKEYISVHRPRISSDPEPSITKIVVHNLLTLDNIDLAKDYLERIYKIELATVENKIGDVIRWTRRLEYELRDAITKLEGVSKPLKFRKYLSDLSNVGIADYLKYFDSKERSEEFMFISDAALKLKRSEKMIRNYISTGKLIAQKDKAGKTIITKESVEAFNKG